MATFLSETKAIDTQLYKVKESFPEFTSDNILEFPWNIWRDLEKADSFFRKNLSNILYHTLQLRFFRNYIHQEVSKKNSRKGTSIKRAYRYSINDAKKIIKSLPSLNLDQLWKLLDNHSTSGSKSLNDRLDVFLSKNFFNILKNSNDKIFKPQQGQNCDNDLEHISQSETSELPTLHKILEHQEKLENIISNNSKNDINNIDDKFFKLDEMEEFADKDFDDENEIDYFDSLGEESDDSIPAADMKFYDFFKDPNLNDKEQEDELKPITYGIHPDDMDEYDKEMELMLQNLENEGVDEENDDELYRDDIEDDFDLEDNVEISEEGILSKDLSLDFDFDNKNITNFNENINEQDLNILRVENELIAPKHWSLMGETTGKDRPRNSILDLELELPQTSSIVYETQNQNEEYQQQQEQQEQIPIEIIITQRIKTGVFDNVERKLYLEDQLNASENIKKYKNDDKINEIDFNKNEMGLGEVYAQKYKEQFMAIDKLDTYKKELNEQFSKLIYKLDSLSNCSFIPKRISESEKTNNVPIISIDTPMNIILSQTPKEIETLKPNKISRNAKKRKFKNKMKGMIKSGKLTKEDVKKIKDKIITKNKKNVEDNKSRKKTGLTINEVKKQNIKSNKKINTNELLCNIGKM